MRSKRGHPSRDVIPLAFARALEGEYAAEIDLTPITGMNIDTVALLIQRTEKFREAAEERARPYPRGPEVPELEDRKQSSLRRMVQDSCKIAEVDPDHRHGYEVLVMCYYRQMFEYQYPHLARKEELPVLK